ncbi:hypothetical protein A6X21_09610 [Planctopirus hydrillae]|uniref:Uncharacterized protein n=1 Tax=Planctopirus hydrillae TaxID=1841610 RepID=A0A1C3E7F2_9PLAN|nr:hypothetical protein A6X21_09610 [Planctopirus hydrillae]
MTSHTDSLPALTFGQGDHRIGSSEKYFSKNHLSRHLRKSEFRLRRAFYLARLGSLLPLRLLPVTIKNMHFLMMSQKYSNAGGGKSKPR